MGTGATESGNVLAELESRARALAAELAAVQAELAVARSLALADRRTGPAEVCADVDDCECPLSAPHRGGAVSEVSRQDSRMLGVTPGVLLQSLPLHDALRRKWGLGGGLPSAGGCADVHFHIPGRTRHSAPGRLRIFGLLSDGQPWEHFVSFSSLAADGGVIIGREQELCDLALADDSVSRIHARLEINYSGLVVTDLQSTNGVFVDDVQVDAYSPQTPLGDGSVLTLGEVPLCVEYLLPN